MNNVCYYPWTSFYVWPNNFSNCCYKQGTAFDLFSQWQVASSNNEFFIKERKNHIEKGSETVCSEIRCPYFHNCENIIEIFRSMSKTDEAKSRLDAIKLAYDNKDVYLNYKPFDFLFNFGYKCNAFCKMCFMGKQENLPRTEPTVDQLKYIGETFIRNCHHLCLTGGEIFVNSEECIDFVFSFINKEQVTTTVMTNASLLTLKKYEKYCENGPVDYLAISLDTIDPEKFMFMRGLPLSMELTNLTNISKKYKINKINRFYCVLTAVNYNGIYDLLVFCNEIGCKSLFFNILNNYAVKGTELEWMDIFGKSLNEEIYHEFKDQKEKCEKFASEKNIFLWGLKEALSLMESKLKKL